MNDALVLRRTGSLLQCILVMLLTLPALVRGECSDRGVPLVHLADKRAFPTAEGDGAHATADIDNSWSVHYVTSKAQSGAGSMQSILQDGTKEKLIVLFAVGGFFDISSILYADKVKGMILAGQTANDIGGVHFGGSAYTGDTRVYFHRMQNFQLRFLDVKQGWWGGLTPPLTCSECWWGIVDHYSSGWGNYCGPIGAGKVNPDANDRGGRNTLQRSLCVEGGGAQNTGSVTGIQADYVRSNFESGDQDRVWASYDNLTVHHNIFIGLTHRFPNTSGNGGVFRILNNLVYGWLSRLSRHTGGHAQLDFVDNVYAQSADTSTITYDRMNKLDGNDYYNMNYEGGGGTYQTPVLSLHGKGNRVMLHDGSTFHDDNVDDPILMWQWFSDNPWGNGNTPLPTQHFTLREERSLASVPVTMTDRDELRAVLLENVGASVRFNDEDATTSYVEGVDTSYLDWVRTNGGPTRYGGDGFGNTDRQRYPTDLLTSGSARNLDEYDADRDGLPDAFEAEHGVTDPWAVKERWTFPALDVVNSAGYVNIQMYLAWKAGDFSLWYVNQGVYNVTMPDDPSCTGGPSTTAGSSPTTDPSGGSEPGTTSAAATDASGNPVQGGSPSDSSTTSGSTADGDDALVIIIIVAAVVIVAILVVGFILVMRAKRSRALSPPASTSLSHRGSKRSSASYGNKRHSTHQTLGAPPPPPRPIYSQWK